MIASSRAIRHVVGICSVTLLIASCQPGQFPPPLTTSLSASTATVVKTSGIIDVTNDCSRIVPPPPNIQAWWNGRGATEQVFPVVGFEISRNTYDGCQGTRLDAYRAVVTFSTSALGSLKANLVTHADLILSQHMLPPAAGTHTSCFIPTGGAQTLDRFTRANQGNVPPVSPAGTLDILDPGIAFPFPMAGLTEFTFPNPWTAGSVPGAADPTTTVAGPSGSATFTVDVTNYIIGALNLGVPNLSWMLTSTLETLPAPSASFDCKTPYDFRLLVSHY